MSTHVLFPGTFDPPTRGHLDLVARAAALFERVTVGIAEHPTKEALFPAARRVELFEACVAELTEREAIDVHRISGLVVDACEALGCDAILRGVRTGTDFDYEAPMAITNRALLPRIETLLLVPSPEVAHVSSTLVRQITEMGGDASGLVPGPVAAALAGLRSA